MSAISVVESGVVERIACAAPREENCEEKIRRLAGKRAAILERSRLLGDEKRSFAEIAAQLRKADVHRIGDDRGTSVPVRAVKFDVLTEREVRKESGFGRRKIEEDINIVETKRFDQSTNDVREGGLYDARLGPISHGQRCPTCGGLPYDADPHREPDRLGVYSCPGHEGRLELCGALYNCAFIDDVIAALRCFCWTCGELPAAPEKQRAVIKKLLERDIDGRPLNRAQRLMLLSKMMRAEKLCHNCMAEQRCEACAKSPSQCLDCSTAKVWRPQIAGPRNRSGAAPVEKKRGGGAGGNSFTSFPFRVVFAAKTAPELRDLERFKQRHNIKASEYVLNPERARAAMSQISASVALLLADDWPARARTPHLDIFLAVLGRNDIETRRSVRNRTLEFLFGMVPRVIPIATNLLRPINNDVNNLFGSTACEITLRYDALVEKNRELREKARSARRTSDNIYVDTASETVDRGAVLRHGTNEPWYALTTADRDYVCEDYGLLQYLYVLPIDPSKATKWLPSSRMVSVPNCARRGAERTKNKGRGFATDQRNKDGLFRNNLMGKRVDFSARSVIVGDPMLDCDELVVPYGVAAVITVPTRLTGLNCEEVLAAAERRRTWEDDDIQKMSSVRSKSRKGAARQQQQQQHQQQQQQQESPIVLLIISPDNTEAENYMELSYPVSEHRWARLAGTVIERPLRDGDIVAFNRAPSLHKPSVMAHRVRLGYGSAFRMSLAVTGPYNADFDGDEMNLHGPQSIVAQVELAVLCSVEQNIVLQRKSGPCIALVQDHLLGASLLGSKDTFLDRNQVYQLMYQAYRRTPNLEDRFENRWQYPAIFVRRGGRMVPYWTGKQLVSMLLPESLNVVPEHSLDPVRMDHVPRNSKNGTEQTVPYHISGGDWLYGTPNKSMFGTTQNGLIHRILLSTSSQSACDDVAGQFSEKAIAKALHFINCMLRLTIAYVDEVGFSMGLGDIMVGHLPTPSGEPLQKSIDRLRYGDESTPGIEAVVDTIIKQHYETERAVARGDTSGEGAYPPMLRVTRLESRIMGAVTQRQAAMYALTMHTIAKQRPRNNLLQTIDCGSKGNITNAGQMIACVGQQQMFGRRLCDDNLLLESNYESADPVFGNARRLMAPDRERTRPSYARGYPGAVEGGFVMNSLLEGITPNSMFDYTISGRSGLTDTAVKTAETGYMQRKCVKFSEDHVVAHDTTVRNCDNRVVSFGAGAGVRFDPSFLVWTRCAPILLSDRDFARFVTTDVDDDARFVTYWSLIYSADGGHFEQSDQAKLSALIDDERVQLLAARDLLRSLPNNDENPGQIRTVGNVESVIVESLRDSKQSLGSTSFVTCSYRPPLDWTLGFDNHQQRCEADVATDAYCRVREQLAQSGLSSIDIASVIEFVNQWLNDMHRWADAVTLANLRLRLSAKQLLLRHCISRQALELFARRYTHVLKCSRMVAGEAIGVVASQSVIEPLTQGTLRTLHGVGNTMKEVTQGVPRYKELGSIRPTSSIATPVVTVRLHPLAHALDELRIAVRTELCGRFGRQLSSKLDLALGNRRFVERAAELRDRSIEVSHQCAAQIACDMLASSSLQERSRKRKSSEAVDDQALRDADETQSQLRDAILEDTFAHFDEWHHAERGQTLDKLVSEWHVCKTDSLVRRRAKILCANDDSMVECCKLFSDCSTAGVLFCVLVTPIENSVVSDLMTYAFWEVAGVVAPHLALQTGSIAVRNTSDETVAIAVGTVSQARLYTQMRLQRDTIAAHCDSCRRDDVDDDVAVAEAADTLAKTVAQIPHLYAIFDDEAVVDGQDAARAMTALAVAPLARELHRNTLADAVQNMEVCYAPLMYDETLGCVRLCFPLENADETELANDFHRLDDTDIASLSSFLGVIRIDFRWFQSAGLTREQLLDLIRPQIEVGCALHAHLMYVSSENVHGDCVIHVRLNLRSMPQLANRVLSDESVTPLVPRIALLDESMLDQTELTDEDVAAMRQHQYQLWQDGAASLDSPYYVAERRRQLGLVDTFDNSLQAQILIDALSRRLADQKAFCLANRGSVQRTVYEDIAVLSELIDDATKSAGVRSPELIVRMRRYFGDRGLREPTGCAEATHVARTVQLSQHDIDAQTEELATAAEINELHRSLDEIRRLKFNCTLQARYIDFEPRARTIYTSEGGVETVDEAVATIDSRSFRSVLSRRGVDVRTATTNAVRDAESVLGIEAARQTHYTEYRQTLQNCDVAACYIAAICDAHSMHGYLVPMTRHGAEYNDNDRLKLATFEESSNVTSQAAIEGALIQDVNSPSALMMFAMQDTGRFGTCSSKLLIDPDALSRVVVVQPEPGEVLKANAVEYDKFAAAWPGAASEQAVEQSGVFEHVETNDDDSDDNDNNAHVDNDDNNDGNLDTAGDNHENDDDNDGDNDNDDDDKDRDRDDKNKNSRSGKKLTDGARYQQAWRQVRQLRANGRDEGYDPTRPAMTTNGTFVEVTAQDARYSPSRPGIDEGMSQRVWVSDPAGLAQALQSIQTVRQDRLPQFEID